MQRIAVIGAGYTGLACCLTLIDRGYEVDIYESTNSIGGLGGVHRLTTGSYVESFYHHFFTHDKRLRILCKRILGKEPVFMNGSMSIYYNGVFHEWNSINDVLKTDLIGLFAKLRFLAGSVVLASEVLPKNFLRKTSLKKGMRLIFGKSGYTRIWAPMLQGKFGDLTDEIPLEWMHGRLKQRIQSRQAGDERLGYLPGSLATLTRGIEIELMSRGVQVCKGTRIESIDYCEIHNKARLELSYTISNGTKSSSQYDAVVFTINVSDSNRLARHVLSEQDLWKKERYFKAICVTLELREPFSKYYWNNIADTSLFFCGYIEQSALVDKEEYNGAHVAYLTKYLCPNDMDWEKSDSEISALAHRCLEEMFGLPRARTNVQSMKITRAKNAQVVTDFDFKPQRMRANSNHMIFMGNMSHVYPDERSINNAIQVGETLGVMVDQAFQA